MMKRYKTKKDVGSIGSEIIRSSVSETYVQLHPKEATFPFETRIDQPDFKPKKLEETDVVIVKQSMFCYGEDHVMIPCRRLLYLLTKEGIEEEYIVYVGYCPTCDIYTMMVQDYLEMVERGVPLCTVYKYDESI